MADDRDGLDILAGFEKELASNVPLVAPQVHAAPPCDLDSYERIVVFFSSGKDSLAAVLQLLERGVPLRKIELHHHDVDGDGASTLFDWPCTNDYSRKLAAHLGLPLYFSWKVGGLERELMRENCGTAPITFTRGDRTLVTLGGERSKPNTRRRFPQQSADVSVRYCSSYGKVQIGDKLLMHDPRFLDGKTLVITGERAEESTSRAKYAVFEPHRADNRDGRIPRWIDHWRNVLHWSESDVWRIIERHAIVPHPCYFVGFTRASCMRCVFLQADGWATNRAIDPEGFERVATLEEEFGVTIHRTMSVREQADRGTNRATDPYWVRIAMSRTFDIPVVMSPWVLPKGAYGKNEGPT